MAQARRKKNERDKLFSIIQETIVEDFLKVLEHSISSIIEAELSDLLGAMHYEHSENRNNYRNGFRSRKRPISSQMGPMFINIPKLRRGGFYPSILKDYQQVDSALISIVSEAFFAGVPEQKLNKLFGDLGLGHVDPSLVDRCSNQIDAGVYFWENRGLDGHYTNIWLDVIYTMASGKREGALVAVLIAIGLKEDGHRDILGLQSGNKAGYQNWKNFLQSLKTRGLESSEVWTCDEHDGLIPAIKECFPGQNRQPCTA